MTDQLSLASVKTYTGFISPYLFSVNYPSTETPRVVSSPNNSGATVNFEITPNGNTAIQGNGQSISYLQTSESLADWVAGAKKDMPSGYTVTSFNETVSGEPAIELQLIKQSDSSIGFNLYVKHGGIMYELIGAGTDQNFPAFVQSLQFTK